MQSFGTTNVGPRVAFVNTAFSFQSSFSRGFLCRSRPTRNIASGPHQQIKAVLDEQTHKNISQDNASDRSGETKSFSYGQDDSEALGSSSQAVPRFEEPWYTVVERIGHADKVGETEEEEVPAHNAAGGVVDLMKLDVVGQQMLTGSSYDRVVDVDMESGGVLDDDEDNNDLHCGVELDALVDSPVLVENLRNDFGIETATHVQLAAIPRVFDGRDLVIQSHTGTGKTLAFLLPILDGIDTTVGSTQALIIAPTRELAMQISRECDRLISGTDIRSLALIGGANPARQVEKLRKRQPHVVVGTPGRLVELCEQNDLRTHSIRWFVVDEVDQCLAEPFLDHVVKLLNSIRRKQIILVSATGDVDGVRQFAATQLHRPVLLRVGGAQRIPKRIQHYCCIVPARMKIEVVKKLMSTSPVPKRAIAFVDDPRRVDIVVEKLYRMGLIAGGLKGNAHKLERADVLTALKKGRINLLVTTEVAARGLDVREITHVFNLDLPTDGDHYLHRAGRCGRVGEEGFVVSIASPDKAFVINRIGAKLGIDIPRMEPRYGKYSQPMVRTRRDAGMSTRVEQNSFGQSDVGKKGRHLIVKKQGDPKGDRSVDDSSVSLQGALEGSDTTFVQNDVGQTGTNRYSDEREFSEVKDKPKKTKAKLKGRVKAKAKARAKAKAKLEAKTKSAERKERRMAQKEADPELGDDHSPGKKKERKTYNRQKSDIRYRAISEGWVGNRVGIKAEE